MISEFDSFIGGAMTEVLGVLGTDPFKIGTKSFTGAYNQFTGSKSLMGEGGGYSGTYPATIVAALAQFTGKFAAPLEKSLANLRLTIKGRTFRIEEAIVDSASVTLNLVNPDAAKG